MVCRHSEGRGLGEGSGGEGAAEQIEEENQTLLCGLCGAKMQRAVDLCLGIRAE